MPIQVPKKESEAILSAVTMALLQKRTRDRGGAGASLNPRELEESWRQWVTTLYPNYATAPFGIRHEQLWEWAWSITPSVRLPPFVAIWPRGGAKSTSAELATVSLAARQARRYGLYISETQDQADEHVGNIEGLFGAPQFGIAYPQTASRQLTKFGSVRGWRRNRLMTASGFTIDAVGLDSAARGAKIDADRPDLMIFDDIDSDLDSYAEILRKVSSMTRKILPAGANNLCVLAVQNLIHPNSIFHQMYDGRADFLADRVISGPYRAVDDLEVEQWIDPNGNRPRFRIVGGTPTWLGQDLETCQHFIDTYGISAFLAECQQEIEAPPGGMYNHLNFEAMHVSRAEVPQIRRYAVWVDPAVTDTKKSDANGIQVDGLGVDGIIYRFFSWEERNSPLETIKKAIRLAVEYGAVEVGVETDNGGDLWLDTFDRAREEIRAEMRARDPVAWDRGNQTRMPRFASDKAGRSQQSKADRSQRMLADYERGAIKHVVGTHLVLERALRRFPQSAPFDLADAAYWAWHDLREGTAAGGQPAGVGPGSSYWAGGASGGSFAGSESDGPQERNPDRGGWEY